MKTCIIHNYNPRQRCPRCRLMYAVLIIWNVVLPGLFLIALTRTLAPR